MYRVTYICDECPHHCLQAINKNNPRNFPDKCLGGGFGRKHQWKISEVHLINR